MPDLLTTLAERLHAVECPLCVQELIATGEVFHARRGHSRTVLYEAMAREALAVVAEALPTREGSEMTIRRAIGRWSRDSEDLEDDLVDIMRDVLLRDLRERLGGKQ